jgi:hypothetical protein
MSAAIMQTGERRRYWLSVAALAIALPLAIVVNSWESAGVWRGHNIRAPLVVERGTVQRYAGAQWRLTGLTRLPEGSADANLIVAEFEAAIDDPELLREGPCEVLLTDDKRRRWQPAFIPPRTVRQARPLAADKPRCGALLKAEKGKTIMMAEAFTVPVSASGLKVFVTIAAARPAYLVFK